MPGPEHFREPLDFGLIREEVALYEEYDAILGIPDDLPDWPRGGASRRKKRAVGLVLDINDLMVGFTPDGEMAKRMTALKREIATNIFGMTPESTLEFRRRNRIK